MTQLEETENLNHANANNNEQFNDTENAQTNGNLNKRKRTVKNVKQFEINIASQNVCGRFGCRSEVPPYIELFNEMMDSKYHIAMLQDTQHDYRGTNHYEKEESQFIIQGEPGTFQQYFTDTQTTHTDTENHFWPFGAIWSECDNTARHRIGSAGVAIILSKLASEALQRAIDSLGQDKAIFQLGPRMLAIRLIFLDRWNKKVQLMVASAYAPPYNTSTKYKDKIEAFYNAWDKLLQECTDDDILIFGGDLNAHVGSNSPSNCRAEQIICPALGSYGLKNVNEAGKRLRDFASTNALRIPTTFFRAPHKQTPAPVAHWKRKYHVRKQGYLHTTYTQNKKCYQLDHFVVHAKNMKRVRYAYPAAQDLMQSDHKTITMTMRIARSLKKTSSQRSIIDYSQIGMMNTEGGQQPNAVTAQYLETVKMAFQDT